MHRTHLAIFALFVGATGIGFAPIFVRLSETGPTATAFYRLLFALPFLWLWVGWDRSRINPATAARSPAGARDFAQLAIAGLFFAADLSLWHWSLHLTTVANSTLLTNFAPICVAIGARFLFGEKITARFLAGMTVALSGAVLLVGRSLHVSTQHLWGDLLSILTAFFYAGYLLSVAHLRRSFSVPTILAWSGLVSCPSFALIAWLTGDRMAAASVGGWLVLAGLALVSHVGGQTLITYAFGHLPASFSSVSLLWQPVVAAVVAWAILGEPLSWLQALGGLIVLCGIAVASGTLNGLRRPPLKA